MHPLPYLFITGLLLSALLTWLLTRHAIRRRLLDHPNERSSHAVSTPRGGGLAIVLVSVTGVLGHGLAAGQPLNGWFWFLLPALLIAAVSYLDDYRDLPARYRFAVHLCAALMAVLLFLPADSLLFSWPAGLFDLALTAAAVILLVWFLNLFNFMDGTDGIASVEALFIAGALLLLSGQWAQDRSLFTAFNLLIIASTTGFLFWNWPTAKIFMGDVGSSFLGFVLGVCGLYAVSQQWITLWTLLVLFGLFFVDATYTLLRRVVRGERWYQAHRSHAYQKFSTSVAAEYGRQLDAASARAKAHRLLCYAVTAINLCWLLPIAWLTTLFPQWGVVLMLAAFLPLVMLEIRYAAGVPE